MAKKKFGLSSTLNKNSKTEEPTLPKKIPLNRSKKNIEEVKEKVEAIHETPLDKINRVEEPLVEMIVKVKDEDMAEMISKVQPYAEDHIVEIAERKEVPTEKPKRKYTKKPKTSKPERMVRITVDTPKSMHIKLKIKAIENDITIRDYVIGLIKDDLGLN